MDEQQQKWEGIFRGSVLTAAFAKHISFLTSADTRAQGLILLNAALVPLSLSGMQTQNLRLAATMCALTSLVTITLCIFSLYPKRIGAKNRKNILHYVQFGAMREEEFLEQMRVLLADKQQLTEAAVRDLYHLGKNILAPKYVFLRLAYISFLVGQLPAALIAVQASR